MNLIEATMTGRPFRRKGSDIFIVFDWKCASQRASFTRADLLADDWEIQEKEVTITRTQFWAAAEKVKVTVRNPNSYEEISLVEYLKWPITDCGPLVKLAAMLGLED